MHDKPCRVLAVGDTPPEPMYVNWKHYFEDPDDCRPMRTDGVYDEFFDPKSNFGQAKPTQPDTKDEDMEDATGHKPEVEQE